MHSTRAGESEFGALPRGAALLLGLGLPLAAQDPPQPPRPPRVDLTDEQLDPRSPSGAERLARRWFENVDIHGFGAFGYLDTGRRGTRPDGGFLVKEASLFVEAEVWRDARLFCEIQTNRLGEDDALFVRTGEVYAAFTNVLAEHLGDGALGLKVGRIDVPFGEEYLWQDSIDNPLITQSAAYPYGFDEGVLLHGSVAGVGWLFAVTDGNEERSEEDGTAKAFHAKAWGKPTGDLHLSASAMSNGRAGESAIEFGGSHLQPVGTGASSSAGTSPSSRVDASLFELDAKYHRQGVGSFAAAFGGARIGDDAPGFDRDIHWGLAEVRWDATAALYFVARASEIGTYSRTRGYHFDGKIVADGEAAFGYDTKRLQRLSVGAGYAVNPLAKVKLEVGRDRFWLIDQSALAADDGNRVFVGIELAVAF